MQGFCKYDWIKTIYRLIQNKEWITARHVYDSLVDWSEKYWNSFDLKTLCNINKVLEHQWVVFFILELMEHGSDYHSLCVEKGESFLHASIRLTLASGMFYNTFEH
jgi:hypothetical protein